MKFSTDVCQIPALNSSVDLCSVNNQPMVGSNSAAVIQ